MSEGRRAGGTRAVERGPRSGAAAASISPAAPRHSAILIRAPAAAHCLMKEQLVRAQQLATSKRHKQHNSVHVTTEKQDAIRIRNKHG